MHSTVGATIALGAVTMLLAGFSAHSGLHAPLNEAGGTIAVIDTATMLTDSTGAPIQPRWLSDANIISLLGAINARQIAAADVELEGWHSDDVRTYAAAIARDHAELQHAVDSISEQLHTAPVAPALGATIRMQLQTQIDSMIGKRGAISLDRAFAHEQVASHALIAAYAAQLSTVAMRPEVKNLVATVAARVDAQTPRAAALQAMLVRRDSVAAVDSAVVRAARAARAARIAQPPGPSKFNSP